ncbi:MAG TPA: pectate lyase [Pyrinomonadaceae bacterium]|nr:pectate lyase [Pyrinomonadaceae bacterium]
MALRLISFALFLFVAAAGAAAAQTSDNPALAVKWRDALRQKPEWYAGAEALRVADNLLLYQREVGGWPKNIDMAAPLSEKERAELLKLKTETGKESSATIDNGATFTQLEYLARVHTAQKQERHREAFLKGLDYLLAAQYENGGWPQYYPLRKGYYSLITYNDNAMVGVLELLRDVARREPEYAFVDEARRLKSEKAVERGVECILKTQVKVEGRLTAWGAQHDVTTFAPAPARKFEPVSLASRESVAVTRFLMGVERPDARVVESIESAVAWFKATQLSGIRWVEREDKSVPGGIERTIVKDPQAPPLWARFYEIGTNRPVFEGRDGVVRYDVMEIEAERRNGYGWYTEEPNRLLNKDYTAWQKRLKKQSTEQSK